MIRRLLLIESCCRYQCWFPYFDLASKGNPDSLYYQLFTKFPRENAPESIYLFYMVLENGKKMLFGCSDRQNVLKALEAEGATKRNSCRGSLFLLENTVRKASEVGVDTLIKMNRQRSPGFRELVSFS